MQAVSPNVVCARNMTDEISKAVLSACFVDPDTIRVLAPLLEVEDFLELKNKLLWACFLDLYSKKEKVTFVSAHSWLVKHKKLETVGADYLADIRDYLDSAGMESTAEAPKWAGQLVEASDRRKLAEAAERIREDAKDVGKKIDEVFASAVEKLQRCRRQRTDGFRPPSAVEHELLDMADEWFSGSATGAISTGYPSLDAMLSGGLRQRMLYVLGARPAMGKTAFCWSIAKNIAEQLLASKTPGVVGILSLEMSMQDLLIRATSSETRIENRDLMSGNLRDMETMAAWCRNLKKIGGLPIRIDDSASLSSDLIRYRTGVLDAVERVKFLIIDYAELVADGTEIEELRVSGIFKAAKAIAKELSIPVMLLSQLSREVEKLENKVPNLRHLRYGGSAEAAADYVIFCYDPWRYVEIGEKVTPAEGCTLSKDVWYALVEKARYGQPGIVPFRFERPYLRWTDTKVVVSKPGKKRVEDQF